MSNKLTLAEVEHIAELAKLGLDPQEAAMFQEQLSQILAYAETLQELDTADISPTAQGLDGGGQEGQVAPLRGMREDRVTPSLPQDQALANAPDQQDGQFKVHPILDE